MRPLVASAPGKLFLAGEYAVLEGAPAVLTAVDRRALARFARADRRPSPIVAAVRAEIAARFPDLAGAPPLAVATRGFARGRAKLGLGSSAAVAVASTALLLARAEGAPAAADRVLAIAQAAHRAAQGGRGSGADVAASALGGTIRFRIGAPVEPLGPIPVALAFVWTGRAASTAELIGRVQALAAADPAAHGALLRALAEGAAALAAAWKAADAAEIVRRTGEYGALMARLGERAGAPIVDPAHARAAALAAAHGGAGKPSGAGGGDLALAAFAAAADRDRFVAAAARAGLPAVELCCGERGAEVAAGVSPARAG